MTKVIWNKTAKHLPRKGVPVIVCHYEDDTPGNPMYQAVAALSSRGWYLCDDEESIYTPKYWTQLLEMPE